MLSRLLDLFFETNAPLLRLFRSDIFKIYTNLIRARCCKFNVGLKYASVCPNTTQLNITQSEKTTNDGKEHAQEVAHWQLPDTSLTPNTRQSSHNHPLACQIPSASVDFFEYSFFPSSTVYLSCGTPYRVESSLVT